MKNYLIILLTIILTTSIFGQNTNIVKNDFENVIKQIKDSLPSGWFVKEDLTKQNEIIIQSMEIDLNPDMASNDPLNLKGKCEISILIVSRISLDSIKIVRTRNKKLHDNLPPQVSKDNLRSWYIQNEKTIKLLDEEPTNYDNKYSYRIKCSRLPKNSIDIIKYNQIIAYLNRQYKKYQNYTLQNFDAKVKMAQLIIKNQPSKNNIKNILLDGFTLDSINTTGYYIKYTDKIQLIAYLYKNTERTVAVDFYESNDTKKEIYDYIANEMKYIYTASEHMCDYYKKEKSSIRFCPNMNKGLMVYIENF